MSKMNLKGEPSPQRSSLACWRIELEAESRALKGLLWQTGVLKDEHTI
jgi:hypothetical protein